MIMSFRSKSSWISATAFVVGALSLAACGRKEPSTPPVAKPSVTVNRKAAPLGSPIEITYKFVVANDAKFAEDYRVMLHVVDADDELMWTDDHDPPTPTTEWKPGQTVEYTRTVFVPVYPYVGDAGLQVGLYSIKSQTRLTLDGEDVGQHAYKAGTLQLQPQSENIFTVFKDGWHPAEVAEHNASVEWQWTKKQATLAFKNPKKDATFYLQVDNPGGVFNEKQKVTVTLGGSVLDEFELTPQMPVGPRPASARRLQWTSHAQCGRSHRRPGPMRDGLWTGTHRHGNRDERRPAPTMRADVPGGKYWR